MPLRPLDEIADDIAACVAQLATLRAEKKRTAEALRAREIHKIAEEYVSAVSVRQLARKWKMDPGTLYALMNSIGVQRYNRRFKQLSGPERYRYRLLRQENMPRQQAMDQIFSARRPVKPLVLTRRAAEYVADRAGATSPPPTRRQPAISTPATETKNGYSGNR